MTTKTTVVRGFLFLNNHHHGSIANMKTAVVRTTTTTTRRRLQQKYINSTNHRTRGGIIIKLFSSSSDNNNIEQQRQQKGGYNNNDDKTVDDLLNELQLKMIDLNDGKEFNINSPKQVSEAIFGTIHNNNNKSTSRESLLSASFSSEKKQSLAQLVLQYRQIKRQNQQQQQKNQQRQLFTTTTKATKQEESITTSSLSSTTTINNDNKKEEESWYKQFVSSLFLESSSINLYWKDILMNIQKPSAQSMVLQLNPNNNCPMGYDSLAMPNNDVRRRISGGTNTTPSTRPKTGMTLLSFVQDQKRSFPECVLLVRVGEFYESFGLDAVLLVEYCGLNAMAGKCRAGCPIRNIQPTLDCLTSQGFRVAVYEEATDTNVATNHKGSNSKLKHRMLSQIVSSASPTYLYNLILKGTVDDSVSSLGGLVAESRPYVGIISSIRNGYTIVEVSIEERTVKVSERLTPEAVSCRLAAYPPVDPLIYVSNDRNNNDDEKQSSYANIPTFLKSSYRNRNNGPANCGRRIKTIPSHLALKTATNGISDVERAKRITLKALGDLVPDQYETFKNTQDFRLVTSSDTTNHNQHTILHTKPLYLETAKQLGLMTDDDKTIPSLVSSLVAADAPAACKRFLRRWLLTPPPSPIADAMASIIYNFMEESSTSPQPPSTIPPIGRIVALLRAGQASAPVYSDILLALKNTISIIETNTSNNNKDTTIVEPMMKLLEYETGLAANPTSVTHRCRDAITIIQSVVSPFYHNVDENIEVDDDDDVISDFGELVPRTFFERNELNWRGRVQISTCPKMYQRVRESAVQLTIAVANNFWMIPGTTLENILQHDDNNNDDAKNKRKKKKHNPPVLDIFNNQFAIKYIPRDTDNFFTDNELDDDAVLAAEKKYFHPRDRNGKILRQRYTTDRVQDALSEYITACENAREDVETILRNLSRKLCDEGHLPAIVQASHLNLILATATQHTLKASRMGWSPIQLVDNNAAVDGNDTVSMSLKGVWPYWMNKNNAVANTFDLDGMFLLTAPNMSGKSTVMRSTASTALLASCGLCAPVEPGSSVRRFDNIFVRGASSDIPSENLSAFGAEVLDIASLLRCCTANSLVFVDELGRGTSPRDGTGIAAAVMEEMASTGMSGIFATHLHGILKLDLKGRHRIQNKRMAVDIDYDDVQEENISSSHLQLTYLLEDGICTDSQALETAARFGFPSRVLNRAKALITSLNNNDTENNIDTETEDIDHESALLDDNNSNDIPFKNIYKQQQRITKSLYDAIQIASQVMMEMYNNKNGEISPSVIRIPPKWNPPPSLERSSCVYILAVPEKNNKKNQQQYHYYVGETDSLWKRLKQHRCSKKMNLNWSMMETAVFPIDNKSDARTMESLLIRQLAQTDGFDLLSTTDGNRTPTLLSTSR
eukprot:CAMPEP_0194140440 /NCGR_PEP_ID=MMETSP0152-20130528/9984_1 /TAXON_ID=1049557 /ORGANISM="Thalassiothrix antarctica, Strain L6-D1" /LENGTH=1402 /DNA_ID=CAMNT_0038838687 /DNA_START=399 /DNA_END=4607 /DNA_ORIENTATION=+